jgi:hypothetical protein
VKPHEAHGLETHERAEQSTNQGDQGEEDGDPAGNDVRKD